MRSLPILTFHALETDDTPISFAPTLFERTLRGWHDKGWRTISLVEAVRLMREGAPFPEKSFVLTFDDGYASVYHHGFAVMQSMNMTATIFVVPDVHQKDGAWTPLPSLYGRAMLSWHEIRELHAHGFTFGAHSLTHRDLTTLDDSTLRHELRASRDTLGTILGADISLFCYPFGSFDARVRDRTGEIYDAACSVRLGLAKSVSDRFALERVDMYYLRASWAADSMTKSWFPLYLAARNLPRTLRKRLSPAPAEIAAPHQN